MADQQINITLGTRYDGGGIASTVRGLNSVMATTAKTGSSIGKVSSSIGVLGGVLGQMPGKIGSVAQGLLGLGSALTGGPVAIISSVIMMATLAVSWIRKMSDETDNLIDTELDAHNKRMGHIREEETAYKRAMDARKAQAQSDNKTLANDLPAKYQVQRAQLDVDIANARAAGDKEGERAALRQMADLDAMAEQEQLEAKRQAAEERRRIAEEELRQQQMIDRKLLDEQTTLQVKMDNLLEAARGKVSREVTVASRSVTGMQYTTVRKTNEQYAKDVADAEAAARSSDGYHKLADALAKVTAKREANNGDSIMRAIAEASSDADAASAAIQAAQNRAKARRINMEAEWSRLDATAGGASGKQEGGNPNNKGDDTSDQQEREDALYNRKQMEAIRETARQINEKLKGLGVTAVAVSNGGNSGGNNGGNNGGSNNPLTIAAREAVGIGRRRDPTGYNYTTDANGNLTQQQDTDRAMRYAEHAERDAKRTERDAQSRQMGPNRRARDDARAINIQGRLNDGRYVSDRDRGWLRRRNLHDAQESTKDPVVTKLDEVKRLLEQSLQVK